MKKVILVLILVLLGLVAACGRDADPIENEPHVVDVESIIPDADSEYYDDEFSLFEEDYVPFEGHPDINWDDFPIIVNGDGIMDAPYTLPGHDTPTHVPFGPVMAAFGLSHFVASFEPITFGITGLNGEIIFEIGSDTFYVDDVPITLEMESFRADDGTTFVPISFFPLVFGAENAFWSEGHVVIIAHVH